MGKIMEWQEWVSSGTTSISGDNRRGRIRYPIRIGSLRRNSQADYDRSMGLNIEEVQSLQRRIKDWMFASHRVFLDPLNEELYLWDENNKLLCKRSVNWKNYDEMTKSICGEVCMGCPVDQEKATMIMLGGYDTEEA